jgi:hypothetical protein
MPAKFAERDVDRWLLLLKEMRRTPNMNWRTWPALAPLPSAVVQGALEGERINAADVAIENCFNEGVHLKRL